MKTFKSYNFWVKNFVGTILFTLHHFSFGIYWAAPASKDTRLVSVSLHLPFFIFTVSWTKGINT